MLPVRFLLLMAGSIALSLTFAGCGVEVPSSPTLSPVAGVGQVLDAARTAMVGVDSYRFTMDQTWENARATAVGSLDTPLTRLAIQGEWVSPNGYRVTQTYIHPSEGLGRTLTHLSVDDQWLRFDSENEEWIELGFPVLPVPRYRGRPEIGEFESARLMGKEILGNASVYRVLGESTIERDNGTFTVSTTLYIGETDLRLLRKVITAEIVARPGEADDEEPVGLVAWREATDFFDYGVPLAIELPGEFVARPNPADATLTPIPTATPTPSEPLDPSVPPHVLLIVDGVESQTAALGSYGWTIADAAYVTRDALDR